MTLFTDAGETEHHGGPATRKEVNEENHNLHSTGQTRCASHRVTGIKSEHSEHRPYLRTGGLMRPWLRSLLVPFTLALLFLPTLAFAQSQATTGVIEGTVADASGAVLPGVTVTIRNTATNYEQ